MPNAAVLPSLLTSGSYSREKFFHDPSENKPKQVVAKFTDLLKLQSKINRSNGHAYLLQPKRK